MNDILTDYVGQTVEVRSQSMNYDHTDYGVLVAFDSRWVQLQKDNGEILFFPIANIRLLKLLEA